jgi:hypothetical protein
MRARTGESDSSRWTQCPGRVPGCRWPFPAVWPRLKRWPKPHRADWWSRLGARGLDVVRASRREDVIANLLRGTRGKIAELREEAHPTVQEMRLLAEIWNMPGRYSAKDAPLPPTGTSDPQELAIYRRAYMKSEALVRKIGRAAARARWPSLLDEARTEHDAVRHHQEKTQQRNRMLNNRRSALPQNPLADPLRDKILGQRRRGGHQGSYRAIAERLDIGRDRVARVVKACQKSRK